MEAFLVSTTVVALGEIGDKTQLLALMLAVRFRRPRPIVAGILVATLVNHTIAAALGSWIRGVVAPDVLKWLLALSFFAVAAWALKPDTVDDKVPTTSRLGVFAVTTVAFFLAEMGDKTQIATAILAARFDSLAAVVAGTTLGMLVADVPAVFAGKLAADRISFKAVRIVAALLFATLGAWVLIAGVPA
jgi:putative Ca2+/H+ antiporter (TMEM165/GDT1 family)